MTSVPLVYPNLLYISENIYFVKPVVMVPGMACHLRVNFKPFCVLPCLWPVYIMFSLSPSPSARPLFFLLTLSVAYTVNDSVT